jgi:hypothetical protein
MKRSMKKKWWRVDSRNEPETQIRFELGPNFV